MSPIRFTSWFRILIGLAAMALGQLAARPARSAPPPSTRVAVVVGANAAIPGRVPLLFGHDDARQDGQRPHQRGRLSPRRRVRAQRSRTPATWCWPCARRPTGWPIAPSRSSTSTTRATPTSGALYPAGQRGAPGPAARADRRGPRLRPDRHGRRLPRRRLDAGQGPRPRRALRRALAAQPRQRGLGADRLQLGAGERPRIGSAAGLVLHPPLRGRAARAPPTATATAR